MRIAHPKATPRSFRTDNEFARDAAYLLAQDRLPYRCSDFVEDGVVEKWQAAVVGERHVGLYSQFAGRERTLCCRHQP